jgi:hypothetical protein
MLLLFGSGSFAASIGNCPFANGMPLTLYEISLITITQCQSFLQTKVFSIYPSVVMGYPIG